MADNIWVTRNRTMALGRIGDLMIVATGNTPIDDATWREHVGQMAESVKQGGPYVGVLAWVPKHGPSAAQRKILTEEFGEQVRMDTYRRNAVITDSAMVRGVLTAISWLTSGKMKVLAFAPNDLPRALDWLAQASKFDRNEAERLIVRLRDQVDGHTGSYHKTG